MQYKGDDLDLRVPDLRRQPRESYAADYDPSPVNGRWPRAASYGTAPDPLWVDEMVLACCNYAYDIAMANGAGEVGLEHLVNALTRVEAAARILEARGVREGQLRRESASLIASEIPIAAVSERNPPRRSSDFEDVLRRAVEQASRRGSAATVDDVLWVILHYGRDVPAVLLLRRHTPDWQRQDWQRQDPLRQDSLRQDWQRPDWRRDAAAEPRNQPLPVAPQPPPGYAAYDAVANRIALMEDSLRQLHAEIGGERKAIADLIRDTQRDIVAQRGDAAALRSDLAQRLEALERGLQARPEATRLTVQLSDRIQTLEKAVHGGLGEGARNWAALGQRLQGLETALEAVSSLTAKDSGPDHKPLFERIAGLEQALEGKLTQTIRVTGGLADRLATMERLMEAGANDGGRNWSSLAERLTGLETLVRTKPAGTPPEVAELVGRFGGMEQAVRSGFGESLRTISVISDRLAIVEKAALAAPTGSDDEGLLMIDDRIQSIERLLQDQAAQRAAPQKFDFDIGELAAPLTRRIGVFEEQSAERARTLEAVLRETANRIATLEQRVASGSSAQDEAMRGRDREVAEMHEAVVRLSENQHTLASAIADWRHESHTDFGTVTAALEKMTTQVGPAPITAGASYSDLPSVARGATNRTPQDRAGIDQVSLEVMPSGSRAAGKSDAGAAARQPPHTGTRGHGFWWWLFGTDNIPQANRDAEIRWKQMHERMRDARDRKSERT